MGRSPRTFAAAVVVVLAGVVSALAMRGVAPRGEQEQAASHAGRADPSPVDVEGATLTEDDGRRGEIGAGYPRSAAPATPQTDAPSTADARDALTDRDPFVRAQAVEALALAGRVDALTDLMRIDLDADPRVSVVAVKGIGRLATLAEPGAREAAARHLGGFLARRVGAQAHDRAALGDVLATLDALADSGSRAAGGPLLEALRAEELPLTVRTKVVEALSALEITAAASDVARFERSVAAQAPSEDPLEAAVRAEAVAAARAALARLASAP